MDDLIIDSTADKTTTLSKVYEDLSILLFNLLFRGVQVRSFKSWKNNLQLLRDRFSK